MVLLKHNAKYVEIFSLSRSQFLPIVLMNLKSISTIYVLLNIRVLTHDSHLKKAPVPQWTMEPTGNFKLKLTWN